MNQIITPDSDLWLPEETGIARAARQSTTRRSFLTQAGAGVAAAAAAGLPTLAAAQPTDMPVVITINNEPDFAVRDSYGHRTNMATGQLVVAGGLYAVAWTGRTIAQIADKLVLFFRSMKDFFVDFHKWANPNGDFNAWFGPMNTRFSTAVMVKFLNDKARQLNESNRAYIARMGAYVFSFFASAYLSVLLEAVVKSRIAPLMSNRFGSCTKFFNTAMASYAASGILAAFSVWVGNVFADFVGRAASSRRRALLSSQAQMFCDRDFFMHHLGRFVRHAVHEVAGTGRHAPTSSPRVIGRDVRWIRGSHSLTGRWMLTDFHLNTHARHFFHGPHRGQVNFILYSRDPYGYYYQRGRADYSLAVFRSGKIF